MEKLEGDLLLVSLCWIVNMLLGSEVETYTETAIFY